MYLMQNDTVNSNNDVISFGGLKAKGLKQFNIFQQMGLFQETLEF